MNCGACTYVCPTCYCFDIADNLAKTSGERVKTWDSCMFANFTKMGGGVNPRIDPKEDSGRDLITNLNIL